jgi:hypothetical protein
VRAGVPGAGTPPAAAAAAAAIQNSAFLACSSSRRWGIRRELAALSLRRGTSTVEAFLQAPTRRPATKRSTNTRRRPLARVPRVFAATEGGSTRSRELSIQAAVRQPHVASNEYATIKRRSALGVRRLIAALVAELCRWRHRATVLSHARPVASLLARVGVSAHRGTQQLQRRHRRDRTRTSTECDAAPKLRWPIWRGGGPAVARQRTRPPAGPPPKAFGPYHRLAFHRLPYVQSCPRWSPRTYSAACISPTWRFSWRAA